MKYFIGTLLLCMSLGASATTVDNSALTEALKNHSCGKVNKNMYMGKDSDGMLYFSARCNNRREYIVQIDAFSANISTRILECSIANSIGIKCFKKLR